MCWFLVVIVNDVVVIIVVGEWNWFDVVVVEDLCYVLDELRGCDL